MFVLFFVLLTLSSCGKDNDLFLDAIGEDIAQNGSEKPAEETPQSPTDGNNSNGENPTVEIPEIPDLSQLYDQEIGFQGNVGNNIPMTPANPNRIIYVAVNGSASNSGLSQSSPKDINTAFNKDFIQAGDVFYIKAGKYTYGTPSGTAHYDLSNLPCTPDKPCYWIGYKDTPGDINSSQYATVSWDDYKARPRNSDGTHDLDSDIMPTFSGNSSTGKYIDNESLFYTDGGEQGFVFRNMQIQYFRRGFNFKLPSYMVFDNVVQANHGWFTNIEGQGGSNTDLQGTAFLLYSTSSGSSGKYNVIRNSATYNMTFRGFSIGNSENSLIEFSESVSDIDNGNPQDYYFHTTGKNNLFRNLKAKRLVSSNHSGHGVCFNQLSKNNTVLDSEVEGTSIHLDGASYCLVKDVSVIGNQNFGLYKGGGISFMDNAEYNIVDGAYLANGENGFSFQDSGKNSYEEHPGQYNMVMNSKVENVSHGIIELGWWNELTELVLGNVFTDCTFSNAPYLFIVSRPNSGFVIENCKISNITNLQEITYKNTGGSILNPNTQFIDSNFWNSEVPSKDNYIVTNVTNTSPN